MKAVVARGGGKFSLENVPIPNVNPTGALIEVKATGVCGTDIEILHGTMGYYTNGSGKFPIVPGHEWAGLVVALGSKVRDFKVGDHVVGETTVPCHECDICKRGLFTICPSRVEIGVLNHNGAFAHYLVYPDTRTLHKISRSIPWVAAASTEPASIAFAGIEASPLQKGDTVVIMGDGTIGLYLLQVAKVKGARNVIVVGGIESRLAKARQLGACAVINFHKNRSVIKEIQDTLRRLNNGKLANLVVEATGNPTAVEMAIDLVEPGSQITLLGIFGGKKSQPFDFEKLVINRLTIKGVLSSSGQMWDETIKLIESKVIDPLQIISHTFPLEDFPRAVEVLDKKLDNVMKVVIVQGHNSHL